ncbi:hypothetical protein [Pseudooceanicola algae]|uniref:Uncharacterized protein n=1 Tax=Pseudooceanicola algae TaxID=1537215 RepID=A0A418SKJ5_9RHOB|nr:hypothetical protein [Pseudooceanicola algae]QPM90749.1 hypothetical protein PSAL_019890 [Pseudooceanicola algae]
MARFTDLPNASHIWYFPDERFMQDLLHTVRGEIDRHDMPGRSQGDLVNPVMI